MSYIIIFKVGLGLGFRVRLGPWYIRFYRNAYLSAPCAPSNDTGNFRVRLIFANFATVIKTRKLLFVNIFAHHYNI